MSVRGFFVVSLFLGSMVAINAGAFSTSFDWNPPVVITSGDTLSLKISAAPSHEVTVTLTINGTVTTTTVEVPGVATLKVPGGQEGQQFTLTLEGGGESVSSVGMVI
jgi:hypothetical protein